MTLALIFWADGHTAITLKSDGVTDQLPKLMGSQGHREAMRARLHGNHSYDPHLEMLQNTKGEERSRYLQERDAQGTGNYSTERTPASTRRFNAEPTPPSLLAPRSCGRGSREVFGLAASRPQRTPNPNRAPSPSAAGRVRDVHGHRTVTSQPTPAAGSLTGARAEAAGARTAAASALPPSPPRQPLASTTTTSRPAVSTNAIRIKAPLLAVKSAPADVIGLTLASPASPTMSVQSTSSNTSRLERAMAELRSDDAARRKPLVAKEKSINPLSQIQAASSQFADALSQKQGPREQPVHAKVVTRGSYKDQLGSARTDNNSAIATPPGSVLAVVTNTMTSAQPRALPEREKVPPPKSQICVPPAEAVLARTIAGMRARRPVASTVFGTAASPAVSTQSQAYVASPNEAADETHASTAKPGHGHLNILVTSVAGQIISPIHHALMATMRATMTLSFEVGEIPPKELANMTERIARDLDARSHGLEGVVRSADGLMEETWEPVW